MAESIVSPLIEKLDSLLTDEVKQLRGVHGEVANFKDELSSIEALLKVADAKDKKKGIDESTEEWIKQVRKAAYHIEDVIDEYTFHVVQHSDRHGWKGFLHKITSLVKRLKECHSIASAIQDIKKSIGEIQRRREQYKLDSSEHEASSSNARNVVQHDPRVGSLYIEETEVVGIESSKNELIGHLIRGESRRTVISVVGMGGVGKTTLAKKVYDDREVTSHFDCHAWITVSQSYEKEELLRSIIQKFYEERNEPFPVNIRTMDYRSLIDVVREYLQRKRYLVAFDDVWEIGFWRDVEYALLDNNKGSRILTTTRKKDVAYSYKKSSSAHIHQMEPLPQEKAWELFCRKVFQFDSNDECPEELKEMSIKIVARCGGLPLAIVVVGGLLATKEKVVQEWQKLCNCLGSLLVSDPEMKDITRILSISYGDLPYNLRSCFLYFGMFPKDCSLKRNRLIRLWIAGGFVKEKQGMTLEEAAEEYMTELIHRSLVQGGRVNFKGKPSTCQVHDLVHDVILSESEGLSFCQVQQDGTIFEGAARHLSIGSGVNNVAKSSTTRFHTRSLVALNKAELPKPLICTIFETFRLLNVLDFEEAGVDYIPKELGNLWHLGYLSLRGTNVSTLPKSIRKLVNLVSLDLRESLVDELPVDVSRLPKLRHLLGKHKETLLFKIHGGIGHLQFLQTLYLIGVSDDVGLISELERLKQLRKLGIRNLKRGCGKDVCTALEKMTQLQSLQILSEILEIQSMSSPPLHLQTLHLFGRLERLPGWISKLKNLVICFLGFSRLMDDPLKVLQALPNLKVLGLICGYDGKQLHVGRGGFQKLKELYLHGLSKLNSVIIEEGALPVLEVLLMGLCQQLKEVPSGIRHLKALKRLIFIEMPKEFTERLLPDEGQDYWMVQHVPVVHFNAMELDRENKSRYEYILHRFTDSKIL